MHKPTSVTSLWPRWSVGWSCMISKRAGSYTSTLLPEHLFLVIIMSFIFVVDFTHIIQRCGSTSKEDGSAALIFYFEIEIRYFNFKKGEEIIAWFLTPYYVIMYSFKYWSIIKNNLYMIKCNISSVFVILYYTFLYEEVSSLKRPAEEKVCCRKCVRGSEGRDRLLICSRIQKQVLL